MDAGRRVCLGAVRQRDVVRASRRASRRTARSSTGNSTFGAIRICMRPASWRGQLLAAWDLAKPFSRHRPIEIPLPAGAADRNAVPYYDFASQRIIEHFLPTMPVRVSSLRSLGAFGNVFAIESFMDELAEIAGTDTVDYRLRHLNDERAKAVIRVGCESAPTGERSTKGDGSAGAEYRSCAMKP